MNIHQDFQDVLRLLDEANVESRPSGGDLINKKASARPKDLADFDELDGNRAT